MSPGSRVSQAKPQARLRDQSPALSPLILIPTNTQSDIHPIGDGLRVRTAPGQRSAAVELRVGEGLLGTRIGEKWERLPVDAEWVQAPGAPRSIAIDQQGLEAALRARGISMAKPPADDKPDDERKVGIGHNNPPEPTPPLNPTPLVTPIIKSEAAPSDGQKEDDDAWHREIRETAQYIGAGHARTEHLEQRREYPSMTPLEFVNLIEQTMLHPSYQKDFPQSGRKAYWDERSKLLVVEDPSRPDRGTAFRRFDGPEYIRAIRDR